MDYAFGILKTSATNYAIRVGNAQSGNLTTAYDGNTPSSLHWDMHGGIVLGIGGDNSNSSLGTFFEGAITAGRPADSTDAAVLKNVQAAGYGSTILSTRPGGNDMEKRESSFRIRYDRSLAQAIIGYSLPESRRMSLEVFDHQGKRVAVLFAGIASAGSHQATWNAEMAPPGVYVARLASDGHGSRAEKFLIGR